MIFLDDGKGMDAARLRDCVRHWRAVQLGFPKKCGKPLNLITLNPNIATRHQQRSLNMGFNEGD
jgi:hypothetical protein